MSATGRPSADTGPTTLWCELAWLGGETPAAGVRIDLDGDRIDTVQRDVSTPPAGASRLPGLTLPGLANAHSHCFQRALRGRTEAASRGSFWTWREQMYDLAERLDEARYEALARATFAEMALAGVTLVGEFDYVHHSAATLRAAEAAGVRLTLIDACYLHGGIAAFRDPSVQDWCQRVTAVADSEAMTAAAARVRPAAAIHSLRAVDPDAAAVVAALSAERGWPLHAHVSEQPRENEECLAAHGLTPTGLLQRAGALSERFSAVHATHMTAEDVELMAAAGAYCCMCPTTERDLADGIGTVPGRLTLGSDSQSLIDLFEEARAVELDLRLATQTRGSFSAAQLAAGLTRHGYASLGWPEGGAIEPGALADLTTVGLDGVALAGATPDHALASVIFAAGAGDVREVIVGGRRVVAGGRHVELDVAEELAAAVSEAWA